MPFVLMFCVSLQTKNFIKMSDKQELIDEVVAIVVDCCAVDVDGRVMQFVLEDTSEVGYVGDMVVSINKDAIIREVERVKNQSEDALKMVDYHKEAVGKCESLLKEYSPEFKERTETSERMDSMEKQLAEIGSTLKSLMKNIQNQN